MLQAKLNKVFSTDGFTLGLVVQTGDRYLKLGSKSDLRAEISGEHRLARRSGASGGTALFVI